MQRRQLLAGTALGVVLCAIPAAARVISGALPWEPDAGTPPAPLAPSGWQFFTADEGAAVEALVDRLIPTDELSPGGKDVGCAVFIDSQLAGTLWQRAAPLYAASVPGRHAAAGRPIAAHASRTL